MVDSGDTEELYLPGRKIIQLGLKPFGKPFKGKSAHNTSSEHVKFEPPVKVTIKFVRNGRDEEYSEYLTVHCMKDEYDQEVMNSNNISGELVDAEESTANKGNADEALAQINSVSNVCSNEVPSSPKASVSSFRVVAKMSPVIHRPLTKRKQRVLRKLELIANFKDGTIEHEEDYMEYEE